MKRTYRVLRNQYVKDLGMDVADLVCSFVGGVAFGFAAYAIARWILQLDSHAALEASLLVAAAAVFAHRPALPRVVVDVRRKFNFANGDSAEESVHAEVDH